MNWALSVAMLAAAALAAGAIYLWRKGNAGRQAWLMLAAAAVLIANVIILTIPIGG